MGGSKFLPVSGLCKPTTAGSGFLGCLPGAVFLFFLFKSLYLLLSGQVRLDAQIQAQVGWSAGSEEVGLQDGLEVR